MPHRCHVVLDDPEYRIRKTIAGHFVVEFGTSTVKVHLQGDNVGDILRDAAEEWDAATAVVFIDGEWVQA